MADERVRWTDERLDDYAAGVKEDLAEIKAGVAQIRSDELRDLRVRARRAESTIQSNRTKLEAASQSGRIRRAGYGFTLLVASVAASLGAVVAHLLS